MWQCPCDDPVIRRHRESASSVRSSLFIRIAITLGLAWFAAAFAQSAQADSLTMAYTVNQNQTAVVGPGFTVVDFTGSVTNNSDAAIVDRSSPQFRTLCGVVCGRNPFSGITLGPGASTGVIDLAIVTLQPFDPSLPYPGGVGIALEAINPMSGSIFTENEASIRVVTATPEPSAIVLLLSAFAGLLFAGMTSSKLKFTGAPR